MPITYRCDTGHGITVSVWDGAVRFEELRDVVRRQLADPGWPAGRLALTDARTATGLSMFTDEQIGEIAALYRTQQAKISGVKYARVGQGTQGALKFQKAMGPSGPALLVFDDLEPACEWLGINADVVQPILDELRAELRAND
jgi:hypothetical protein